MAVWLFRTLLENRIKISPKTLKWVARSMSSSEPGKTEVYPLFVTDGQLVSLRQNDNEIALVYDGDTGDVPLVPQLPLHLCGRDVVVIDSIYSGTGRADAKDVYQQVLAPLLRVLEVAHTYLKSESAHFIEDYAGSFNGRDSLVIFISGDTSIGEFINGLAEGEGSITFFNVPAGTGNSLALSLDVFTIADAVRLLFVPKTVIPLNLYSAEFPVGSYYTLQNVKTKEVGGPVKFVVVLSWGFHASLVADSDTPELRKHGVKRFAIAAGENLGHEQKYEGRTVIAGETYDGPYAYWLLTPARRFERTFEILPQGDIASDELYFVSFNTEYDNEHYIVDIMKKVYDQGKHVEDARVTYSVVKQDQEVVLTVSAHAPKWRRRFCLDGSVVVVPDGHVEVKVASTGNIQKGRKLYLLT